MLRRRLRSDGHDRLRAGACRFAFVVSLSAVALALCDAASAQQFFNGGQTTPNGSINGGNGVWDNATTNWTNATGTVSNPYDPSVGTTTVFGASSSSTPATGGAVTVTAGGMQLTGTVQFSTTGDTSPYVIDGGPLNLATGGTIFNVNTGAFTPSGIINSAIIGNGGVSVTGSGVITFGGANNYSGGTFVSGDPVTGVVLQVTNNNALSTGTVTLQNAIVQADGLSNLTFINNFQINSSAQGGGFDANGAQLTIAGNVSGNGALTIYDSSFFGGGIVVLTGSATHTGGTTICSCATLQLGDPGHTASLIGTITNEGTLNIVNANTSGITSISNDGSFGGAATTNFYNTTDAGSATITNKFGGLTTFNDSSSAMNANITNAGTGGSTVFYNNSTAGNATIVNKSSSSALGFPIGLAFFDNSNAGTATITNSNGGTIAFGLPAFLGGVDTSSAANATITNKAGSFLEFNASTTAGNAVIITQSGGKTSFFDTSTGGNAQFITNGTGIVDFGQSLGLNSDGRISAGSIAGSGFYYIGGGNTLTVGGNNLSTTVSGVIADNNPCLCTSGPGSLEKVGSGTLTLSGSNTYTGTTTVFGGVLDVEGSIASSFLTTVNAGGALTGAGTVGDTTIASGGIFLPGNGTPGTFTTVSGNLALQSGALYLVQLNSSISTFAAVSGTATLAGTVGASFAPGSIVQKQYTIMDFGGRSGAFDGASVIGGPSALVATVSYDPTRAFLNFNLNFNATPGNNINQQNVGNALTNYFNANGSIPGAFAALSPAGLTQASGELATGTQQVTFDAMNLFLGVLTDPFIGGRGSFSAPSGGITPYADDSASAYARKPNDASGAFARIPVKADAARNDVLDPRWSVWGSAYGGNSTTAGNAALGSNDSSARAFGFVSGADYRISPTLLAGFALAGGGTNFSVNGAGSGRSDLFQAGAFIRRNVGAAYVTGAIAYGFQDVTTDRTVTVAGVDRLRAQFNANAYSGRIEGGYRFATPWVGVTPYAAAQFTTYSLPAYAEQVLMGTGMFALNYNGRNVTDSRTELGLRFDRSYAVTDGIFTLRGRVAWAHDFDPDRTVQAVFQTLPGASFVVNGAAQASDSALMSASVEKKWLNGFSLAATFDSEFSSVTSSYAGKGVLRYQW